MWNRRNTDNRDEVVLLVYKKHKYNDTENIISDCYSAKQRNSSSKLFNGEKNGGHLHFSNIDKLK